jgi:periplasmic protein CpxP/Spy
MNKVRFLMIAVVALMALNIAILAFFLTRNKPARREGPKKVIIERLRFDVQQVAAYDALILKHRADIAPKDKALSDARQAIYSLLKTNSYAAKDSLTAVVGRLQIEVEQAHFAHFEGIKQLCRPDQRADFDALADDLAVYFPLKKGKRNNENQ